jgi:hypothetical protein
MRIEDSIRALEICLIVWYYVVNNYWDECACVVSVCVVLCNSQKKSCIAF